jgi:hypothetical protein
MFRLDLLTLSISAMIGEINVPVPDAGNISCHNYWRSESCPTPGSECFDWRISSGNYVPSIAFVSFTGGRSAFDRMYVAWPNSLAEFNLHRFAIDSSDSRKMTNRTRILPVDSSNTNYAIEPALLREAGYIYVFESNQRRIINLY